MAGKFLTRDAIIDLKKSEERTNAMQRRAGLTMHPIQATVCGCPDPKCGGWHEIRTERIIPTEQECKEIIEADNRARKSNKKGRRA